MPAKKTSQRKKIVLLDSHAILHRAYHAMPDFASSNGEPTGALYGIATMLFSIIKEKSPCAIKLLISTLQMHLGFKL